MVQTNIQKPDLIIEVAGGLGNQMFQYAFYKKLEQLGHHCKLYFDPQQTIHNGYELERVFGIRAPFASATEVASLMDRNRDIRSRIRRKLNGHTPSFYWEHDKGYQYKPELLELSKPAYLQGCWLSEKYFEDTEELIHAAFNFSPFDAKNREVYERIKNNKNAVSIHIRMGDYLKSPIHKKLDYATYLANAIKILRQQSVPDHFYVFSDDTESARRLVADVLAGEVTFISWNKGKESFHDMHLMSHCRHNIISNSTFSWWGAWLNTKKDKTVICPTQWFTTDTLNDHSLIPASWKRI